MSEYQMLMAIMIGGFGFMGSISLIIWRRLEKIEDRINDRIDKLAEKVEDVDRRLCRIEGSLASSGHCLFNQAKPEQKAL